MEKTKKNEAVPLLAELDEVRDPQMDADMALALQLQAEFEQEAFEEAHSRQQGFSKVQAVPAPSTWQPLSRPAISPDDEEDAMDEDDYYFEEADFVGEHIASLSTPGLITKHDPHISALENVKNLAERFPSGPLGNMDGMRMDNRSANTLARKAAKAQKRRVRQMSDEARETRGGVIDERTRVVLFKLVNAGHIDEVTTCISSGKEAVVFYGPTPEGRPEVAVKIFKTTLSKFRNRSDYITGDHRYQGITNIDKQPTHTLIKMWCDKEFRNLSRALKAGLPVPEPLVTKENVLLMSFIGSEGQAAPRLADVTLSTSRSRKMLKELLLFVKTLYSECALVHADLSPYNVLVWKKRPWVIDFGQAVDLSHPRALAFLERDLRTLHDHFVQVATDTVEEMLQFVVGKL